LLPITAETRVLPDLPPLFCREKGAGPAGRTDSSPADELGERGEKAVLCRACRSVVTSRSQAVSISGSHTHTFFNPAGIVYGISCYSRAKGCIKHGSPTDEFTWFKGFTWEFTLCATCHDHLGWFFSSAGSSFFGLISSRLIDGESS